MAATHIWLRVALYIIAILAGVKAAIFQWLRTQLLDLGQKKQNDHS